MSAPFGSLKAALAERQAGEAEAARESERKAGFLADAARFEAEIRDLDVAAADREGDALAAGLPLPEQPLGERRQREKLGRAARASRVAAAKIAARLESEVAAAARLAEPAVIDAALGTSRVLRDKGQATVRAGLEAMVPGLAEMIAAQELCDRFTGATFDFDGTCHPPAELWSGSAVARKFLEELPSRLKPTGLAALVEAAAAERLAALLAELES